MTNHTEVEREHFGDPDLRTGIYAPKVLGDRCSHGKTWTEDCPECTLVVAKQIIEHWGDAVDDARRVIAETEAKEATS